MQANKIEEDKVEQAKKKAAGTLRSLLGLHLPTWPLAHDLTTRSLLRVVVDEAASAAGPAPGAPSAPAATNPFDRDDPFADVVASDRDILAQFEPTADADVVF